jgi:hypothetical protein
VTIYNRIGGGLRTAQVLALGFLASALASSATFAPPGHTFSSYVSEPLGGPPLKDANDKQRKKATVAEKTRRRRARHRRPHKRTVDRSNIHTIHSAMRAGGVNVPIDRPNLYLHASRTAP